MQKKGSPVYRFRDWWCLCYTVHLFRKDIQLVGIVADYGNVSRENVIRNINYLKVHCGKRRNTCIPWCFCTVDRYINSVFPWGTWKSWIRTYYSTWNFISSLSFKWYLSNYRIKFRRSYHYQFRKTFFASYDFCIKFRNNAKCKRMHLHGELFLSR